MFYHYLSLVLDQTQKTTWILTCDMLLSMETVLCEPNKRSSMFTITFLWSLLSILLFLFFVVKIVYSYSTSISIFMTTLGVVVSAEGGSALVPTTSRIYLQNKKVLSIYVDLLCVIKRVLLLYCMEKLYT